MSEAKKKILLVEDEALLAMREKMQLQEYGYDVRSVATGDKAVDVVNSSSDIDVILMDINLGTGIDGTQAAEIILQDHDIPIVFVSSHTERGVVEKTERITSYGYVVKSSSVTVLDASIKMAIKLFDAKKQLTEELTARETTEAALQESEEKFRALFEKGPIGVAYHEMVYDDAGKAIDYRFVDANSSYRELTGVDPRGKLVTEAFPGIENDPFDWIGTFGRVAKTGEEIRFEQYLQSNNRWYDCVAYQVKPDHFVAAFMEITKRKQAEERLSESEERFKSIIALSNTGAWEYHRDANYLWCSPEYFTMLGRNPADFTMDGSSNLEESWIDLIHPDDRERASGHFRDYLSNGSIGMYENCFRMKHGRGDWVWILSRGQTLRDKEGRLTNRTIGTHIDITDRKTMELSMAEQTRELEESRNRYKTLVDRTPGIIYLFDTRRSYLFVSEATRRILGYDPDEIARDPSFWNRYVHPEDKRINEQAVAGAIDGKPYEIEYRIRNIHGDWVWVRDRLIERIEQDDGGIVLQGYAEDITVQKQYQQQLSEQHAFLDAVLDNMLDLVAVADMDGNFLYAGRSHERLGYNVASLIGTNVLDLVHPEDSDYVRNEFALFLQDGNERPAEFRCRCADGSYTWLETQTRILAGKNGEPARILFNSRDVSERKRVLGDKDMQMKEVQHRIKNNINTMTSLLMMQAESLEEPSAVAALNDARSRMNSLSVLYNHLYDTGSGDGESSLREYLQRLVASEIDVFDSGERVDVHQDIEECTCPTRTLSTLGLLVNELITNAMKYAFDNHPNPKLTITGTNRDETYVLVVADNGPGIPNLDEARSSSTMGFMIVDALVQQLGGSIQFQNAQGTRITIEAPVAAS